MAVSIGFVTQTGMEPSETIQKAVEHGFDHVELLMEGNNDRSRLDADVVNESVASNDVDLHAHLPFHLDVASPKEHVREGSIKEVEAAIETAAAAGAEKAVLHAGTQAWLAAWDPEYVKSNLIQSIRHLDEVAEAYEMELCVENLPSGFFTLREDFPRLLAETDASVCLDTGHVLREGWDEAEIGEYVANSDHRVSHLHLADPREDGAVHLPLGSGSTEFETLLRPVTESDWSRTASIEVFTYNFDYLAASKRHVEDPF